MITLRKLILVLLAAVMIFSITANAGPSYPSPTREFFVNDFAGVLSQDVRQKIVNIGKELQDKTTAQVVLATIDSLDGQNIEDYSIDLATKWGIGQKNKDNGVLILFAKKERLLRIEVGYGLEGILPDSKTAQIREQYIKPYTKNNDFDKGFLNGYTAIVKEVAGEYGAAINSAGEVRQNSTANSEKFKLSKNFKFFPILIIILLICDGIFFRFSITSMLIQIIFWSGFFRGGRGGWGGGSGGGSSGGGGGFGGGGSSGNV